LTADTTVGDAVLTSWIDGAPVNTTVAGSVSVTGAPTGGVPLTVATFAIEPASTSACVTRYVAVQSNVPPGASGTGTGHARADRFGNGSDTTTGSNVTLPVLVTRKVYVTTSPTPDTGLAVLSSRIDGACTTGTVTESSSVTGAPTGGVPATVAAFTIDPASTSDCSTV
jgi:hypothetical protein